jgi:hypothetical protein
VLPAALAVGDVVGVLPYFVLLIALHDGLIVAALPFGWHTASAPADTGSGGSSYAAMAVLVAAAGGVGLAAHVMNIGAVAQESLLAGEPTAEVDYDHTVAATSRFVRELVNTILAGGFPFTDNPCQASISTDVVGTTLAFTLYFFAADADEVGRSRGLDRSARGGWPPMAAMARRLCGAAAFVLAVPLLSLTGASCAVALYAGPTLASLVVKRWPSHLSKQWVGCAIRVRGEMMGLIIIRTG